MALLVIAGYGRDARAGYAAIVIEADSGRELHAVNEAELNYPASLTKMMTLYLTFDALDSGRLRMNQLLPVSKLAESRPPTDLRLRAGQQISVRQAVLGLVTRSANDAATVLAEALGGSEWAFARMMTAKARELGMSSTVFRNASGLPDSKQVSTARDLALLARALIRDHPRHYRYFSRRTFAFGGRTYENHNRLLQSYPGLDGIKTGYIRASGYNLAASAERNGERLIAVVLGGDTARGRDRRVAALLDDAFAREEREPVLVADGPALRHAVAEAKAAPDAQLASAVGAGVAVQYDPDAGPTGGWAVQVGVFSNRASARRIAEQAAGLIPGLPAHAIVGVTTTRSPVGKELYRARVMNMTRGAAERACEALTQRNHECIAVEA